MCIHRWGPERHCNMIRDTRRDAPQGASTVNGVWASSGQAGLGHFPKSGKAALGDSRPRNCLLGAQRTGSRANHNEHRLMLLPQGVLHRWQEHLLWTPACGSQRQGQGGSLASHWSRARRSGRSTRGDAAWEINGDSGKLCQEGLKIRLGVRFPSAAGSNIGSIPARQGRPSVRVCRLRHLCFPGSHLAIPRPISSPDREKKLIGRSVRASHHVAISERFWHPKGGDRRDLTACSSLLDNGWDSVGAQRVHVRPKGWHRCGAVQFRVVSGRSCGRPRPGWEPSTSGESTVGALGKAGGKGGAGHILRRLHRAAGERRIRARSGFEGRSGRDGIPWAGETWRRPGGAAGLGVRVPIIGTDADRHGALPHPRPTRNGRPSGGAARTGTRLRAGPVRTPASMAGWAGNDSRLVAPHPGDVHVRLSTAPPAGPPHMRESGKVGLPEGRNTASTQESRRRGERG